jgi:uncharacterized RDD family membrane protein YckC
MSKSSRPGVPEGLAAEALGGCLRRLAAFLLDLAFLSPLLVGLAWAWVRLFEIDLPSSQLPVYEIFVQLEVMDDPLVWGGLLVLSAVGCGYFLVGHLLLQGSAGMRLLGLALVDEWGRAPGVAAVLARVFASLVSTAYFLLGHVWMAFDGSRQAFHDQIAQTWVIRRCWRYLTLPAPSDTQNRGL